MGQTKVNPVQNDINLLQSQINNMKKDIEMTNLKHNKLEQNHLLLESAISEVMKVLLQWHNKNGYQKLK